MTLEHKIREPYAGHIKELQGQIAKLRADRAAALAQAYEAGESLKFIERHLQSILELEIKAADLPNPMESFLLADGTIRWEEGDHGKL